MYSTKVKVRFGDIDHAGIAYYPNLYHYCHVAFEDFFEEHLGTPYPELIEKDRIGFPTVRVESYFKTPIQYGDVLEIAVAISRIGESSATFEFRANRAGDRALCFASVHIVVAVDMETFKPVRIPDSYREMFRRAGAEEVSTDGSGEATREDEG
jgi:YbgC/YbaW family acyl-CoA thioester hydrolase